MEVRLKTVRGDDAEPKTFSVNAEKELKIGRDKKSDVLLKYTGVSNNHAVIKFVPGEGTGGAPTLLLIDGSGNGTSVYTPSGQSSELVKGQQLALETGSVIRIPTRVKDEETEAKFRTDLQLEFSLLEAPKAAPTEEVADKPPDMKVFAGGDAAMSQAAYLAAVSGAAQTVQPAFANPNFSGFVMHPAIAARYAAGSGFHVQSMMPMVAAPWQQFGAPAGVGQAVPAGASGGLATMLAAHRPPFVPGAAVGPIRPPAGAGERKATAYAPPVAKATVPRTPPRGAEPPGTPPKPGSEAPPQDVPMPDNADGEHAKKAAHAAAEDTSCQKRSVRSRSRSRGRDKVKVGHHAAEENDWGDPFGCGTSEKGTWNAAAKDRAHGANDDNDWGTWTAGARATTHSNGGAEDWPQTAAAPRDMAGCNNRPRSPGGRRGQVDAVPSHQQGPSKAGNFTIILRKRNDLQKLGLKCNPNLEDGRTSLHVQKVEDGGLVQEWNEQYPHLAVKEEDQIRSVNGTNGTATEIVETMKTAEHLRIVMHRPSLSQADPTAAAQSNPWKPAAKRALPAPLRPKLTLAGQSPPPANATPREAADAPAAPSVKMQAAPAPSRFN